LRRRIILHARECLLTSKVMNPADEPDIKANAPVEAPIVETVPRWRAVRRLWRAETFYVVALGAFAVLAIFAYLDPYFGWDLKISSAFNWTTFTLPGLLELMRFVSFFGNSWIPYGLTVLVGIIFLLFRRRSEAAGLILSVLGSALINTTLKLVISRPRPAVSALVPVYRNTTTQSFPSGHVTFYAFAARHISAPTRARHHRLARPARRTLAHLSRRTLAFGHARCVPLERCLADVLSGDVSSLERAQDIPRRRKGHRQ
jgi:membrane-associated phospholipid phosphatase